MRRKNLIIKRKNYFIYKTKYIKYDDNELFL